MKKKKKQKDVVERALFRKTWNESLRNKKLSTADPLLAQTSTASPGSVTFIFNLLLAALLRESRKAGIDTGNPGK